MKKDLSIAILCDYYGGLLTDKQREAIDLYYNDDLSLAEMADQLSISRQGAHDNIQRGSEKLYEYESVLHLAEKASTMASMLTVLHEKINASSMAVQDKKDATKLIENLQNL